MFIYNAMIWPKTWKLLTGRLCSSRYSRLCSCIHHHHQSPLGECRSNLLWSPCQKMAQPWKMLHNNREIHSNSFSSRCELNTNHRNKLNIDCIWTCKMTLYHSHHRPSMTPWPDKDHHLQSNIDNNCHPLLLQQQTVLNNILNFFNKSSRQCSGEHTNHKRSFHTRTMLFFLRIE